MIHDLESCFCDEYILVNKRNDTKIYFKYVFMLKPKQLFIIIYINVFEKCAYPHKTNNDILFRYANRSITSWLVYLTARLAATILNATQVVYGQYPQYVSLDVVTSHAICHYGICHSSYLFVEDESFCDYGIMHLNHQRSLIVLSTKVNNLPF
jgi:hypothetical protein